MIFYQSRRMRSLKFLVLPLLMSAAFSAQAATSDWSETPGGKVRVIIEDAKPDGEVRGALQIDLNPGWKTYWRNPGDAGVPPQLSIEGDTFARIDFPAPVHFGAGDEGGIGYKHSVSLPLTFHVKPGEQRLKGHVFLGVCEKICIPVQAQFDFPLNLTSAQSPQAIAARTIIETAFDRLPTPASAEFGIKPPSGRIAKRFSRSHFPMHKHLLNCLSEATSLAFPKQSARALATSRASQQRYMVKPQTAH